MMENRIILASASPRRQELLALTGIPFEVHASQKEERYQAAEPQEIVKELALMKAENVAEELGLWEPVRESGKKAAVSSPACIVIGADTVVVSDGKILGKPADEEDAFRMLSGLQGRPHTVYTGVAILSFDGNGNKKTVSHAEKTVVFVHAMREEEIRRYIAAGESMDKAGAYGIQGRFAAFIDRIEGDYYNVVGLPVAYVYRQLRALFPEAFSSPC